MALNYKSEIAKEIWQREGSGLVSVLGRSFRMIDDQNFDRTLGGDKLQPELLLERSENVWGGGVRGSARPSIVRPCLRQSVRSEIQIEIELARESSLIEDRPIEYQ